MAQITQVVAGYDECPSYAPVFGYVGVACCMVFANFGSAWGTWRAGVGVVKMGVTFPKGVMKNIVPIVMAGVLGIYGLIVSVIITQAIKMPAAEGNTYSLFNGYAHLGAGLCCGMSCLAAGGTIGVIGEVGVQGYGLKASNGKRAWMADDAAGGGDGVGPSDAMAVEDSNKLYVGLLIMLIFSEALALYGLIVALILSQHSFECGK